MQRFPHRVALITGANRGIGREIALQLGRQGYAVVVGGRVIDEAKATAEAFHHEGIRALPVALDVTDPEQINSAVKESVSELGGIHALINNAGVSDGPQHPLQADFRLVVNTFDVNLVGAWRMTAAVAPTMLAANYGRIVNISSRLSILSDMEHWEEPAYKVSKTALNALTRICAAEFTGTGILVNAASPGWVRTRLGGPNAPRSVEEAADTPVWLATLPDDGPTGQLFADREMVRW
jgi:NAD(P)-dependent dehydrogenase (short-subunit alcohol dehydrogenase family)